MASIFSHIIAGAIPCHKIQEDDHHLAFLDINPLVMGHVLVVPKVEVDKLFEMEDDALAALWLFAKPIAQAIAQAVPCKRVGTAVIGLEVAHAHIHLLPLQTVADINFSLPKMNPSASELQAMATLIRQYL